MATKRFASHTEAEILEKGLILYQKTLLNLKKKRANMHRAYLSEKEEEPDFENYTTSQLNSVSSRFYLDTGTSDRQMYKTPSLENFRYGLNRYLKTFDIIKDSYFWSLNETFKTAISELKQLERVMYSTTRQSRSVISASFTQLFICQLTFRVGY